MPAKPIVEGTFGPMLSLYSTESPNGNTTVDIESLAVDFMSFMKAYAQFEGQSKSQIMDKLARTWDLVEVKITIPPAAKN